MICNGYELTTFDKFGWLLFFILGTWKWFELINASAKLTATIIINWVEKKSKRTP